MQRSVSAGEVDLAVAEAGAGGRPFLLVHGFGGSKENFTDYLDRLAERGWWAVAPDLRGHGASAHPPGEGSYSLAIFAGDVLALADALGWERFVLLGESMGGMVAQEVALRAPGRLRGLVLMDTTHGPMEIDPDLLALARAVVREQGLAGLAAALREQREADPLATPAYLRLLRERPGYAEEGERKLLASSADMWLAISAEAPARADLLDRLAGIGVPTLVVCGEQDPLLPHSRAMAAAVPGARLAVIPDAGHSPQFEAPEAWWAALTAFLDPLAG